MPQHPLIGPHMLLTLERPGDGSLDVTGHSVLVVASHIPPPRACSKTVLRQPDTAHLDVPRWEVQEKAMAPHSSTLAWKILWTEEPGGLQSMGSRRVGHD